MRLGIETLKLKRLRRTNRLLLCTPIWTASIAVPVATEGPLYDVYRSVRYDYKDPVPGKVAKVTRSGGTLKRRARLHIRYEYTVAGIPYISDNLWNNSTCVEDTIPLNHLHPGTTSLSSWSEASRNKSC